MIAIILCSSYEAESSGGNRRTMTRKDEQKERTHASILASAARLVRSKGISGARVADVMRGAGLTVGGFYAHFASKEALVDEAVRRSAELLRGRLFEKLADKPAGERAEVVLRRYLSTAHRDELERGCPFPAVIGEVATTAPEHSEVVAEQVEAFVAELRPMLPRGRGGSGTIERRYLAIGLFSLMYGGLGLARAVRGTGLSDDVIRACRALGRAALANHDKSSAAADNDRDQETP
jgi:TetR/AcrR family transcriptional regulator, transcriptional repressor for nem operon